MSVPSLTIRRVSLVYRGKRLPSTMRSRLDQAFVQAMGDLEPVLRALGADAQHLICVQRLELEGRLRPGDSAQGLTEEWRKHWHAALIETIRQGGPAVVSYRSRRHAVTDLVLSVAAGTTQRAWAWTRLGLWSPADVADPKQQASEALRLLASEPLAIVSTLSQSAAAGTLQALLLRGQSAAWIELAQLAMRSAGADASLMGVLATGMAASPHVSGSRTSAGRDRTDLFLRYGSIARALSGTLWAQLAPAKRRAAAALALLESDPAAFARPSAARDALSLLEASLLQSAQPQAAQEHALALPPGTRPTQRVEPKAAEQARDTGTTAAGGLLFLLHLFTAHQLFDTLLADPRLAERELVTVLHRLAQDLASIGPRDAAALAFAGLPPSAAPPNQETCFAACELEALHECREHMLRLLAERLSPSELLPEALLSWVIVRDARVVAEPGWLELHLPLDSVSPELRRSGLDLHPNWLPPLGVVMRFLYE